MAKYLFISFFSLLVFNVAIGQKRDTALYYLQNSGKIESTKDSADFFLLILPPDTTVDKNLYIVKDYYRSGKVAMIGNSKTNTLNDLKFEGSQVTFFPNGHKREIKNFENGVQVGDVIQYYPNGRFYSKIGYVKTVTEEAELKLKDCSDSTGKVLAQNGDGDWINYSNNFTKIAERGKIVNGRKDSIWEIKVTDNTGTLTTFKDGKIIKSEPAKIIDDKFYVNVETAPEFKGGLDGLYKYLGKSVRYPELARRNGTQGRVIIGFIVEKDGSLSDIHVVRGIGSGCDEEAVRIMSLCPHWVPAVQNGKPVRVAYTLPIAFTLSNL